MWKRSHIFCEIIHVSMHPSISYAPMCTLSPMKVTAGNEICCQQWGEGWGPRLRCQRGYDPISGAPKNHGLQSYSIIYIAISIVKYDEDFLNWRFTCGLRVSNFETKSNYSGWIEGASTLGKLHLTSVLALWGPPTTRRFLAGGLWLAQTRPADTMQSAEMVPMMMSSASTSMLWLSDLMCNYVCA